LCRWCQFQNNTACVGSKTTQLVSVPKQHNLCQFQNNTTCVSSKTTQLVTPSQILHKDKRCVFEGKLTEEKLKKLQCYLQPQENIFNVATRKSNKATAREISLCHK
jgi:hypothetical protein